MRKIEIKIKSRFIDFFTMAYIQSGDIKEIRCDRCGLEMRVEFQDVPWSKSVVDLICPYCGEQRLSEESEGSIEFQFEE